MQNNDGSWTPLWFGNEHARDDENPVYGTSRAIMALAGARPDLLSRAAEWLAAAQNPDGGWGGAPGTPSSLEETAVAVHALSSLPNSPAAKRVPHAVRWMIESTQEGTRVEASPIGLYFARLWYFEKLYPLIFSLGALTRARHGIAA